MQLSERLRQQDITGLTTDSLTKALQEYVNLRKEVEDAGGEWSYQ